MPQCISLVNNYYNIKTHLDIEVLGLSQDLFFLKEAMNIFRFPEKSISDMWTQFKLLHEVFDQALPIMHNYIQKNDNSNNLTSHIVHLKLMGRLIEQYQKDLDVLFRDILRKFFNTYIDESNYEQLSVLYSSYVLPQIDDEVAITKDVAMKVLDADFRAEYDIEGDIIHGIRGGAIHKLLDLGESIADIIGHSSELV